MIQKRSRLRLIGTGAICGIVLTGYIWWNTNRDLRLEKLVGEQDVVIESQGRDISKNTGDIGIAIERLDAHDEVIDENRKAVDAVDRKTDAQGAAIGKLESARAELEKNVTEVKERVAEIDALKSRLAKLDQLRSGDLVELEALKERIADLEGQRREADQRLRRIEKALGLIPDPE